MIRKGTTKHGLCATRCKWLVQLKAGLVMYHNLAAGDPPLSLKTPLPPVTSHHRSGCCGVGVAAGAVLALECPLCSLLSYRIAAAVRCA